MRSVLRNDKYANADLIFRYQSAGKRCGQLAITLGLPVLFGWVSGFVTLTNIAPHWEAMQPNTALFLVLAGISVCAAGKSRLHRHWHLIQLASATITLGIGLATLLEYGLGLQFVLDQFFHPDSASEGRRPSPGRMAIATASNFMLLGAALAILDTGTRRLSQLLALLAMGIATLAILGYAYGLSALYDVESFSTMALHMAVGTLLVGMGVLLVRLSHGMLAVMVSGTVGGVLARRLLPLAIATPFLLGWLRIEGERRAFYDASRRAPVTTQALHD